MKNVKDSFSKENEMIQYMDSVLDGVQIRLGSEKYQKEFLFFIKENEILMYLHSETKILYVSYFKIWQDFKSKFQLDTIKMNEFFIKYMWDRFNLKGIKPTEDFVY